MTFSERLNFYNANMNLPVIQMGFSQVHTIERERRDPDALPIVAAKHFGEHHTDRIPTRNQIQAHYTPRNVYF